LRNPYAHEAVEVRRELWEQRRTQSKLPWWRRRSYLAWRWIRHFVRSVVYEATRMPVRTLYDVITGLPLGLLAWPAYRDWLVQRPWAGIAFPALIGLRVAFGAWRRGHVKMLVMSQLKDAGKVMLAAMEFGRAYAQEERAERDPSEPLLRRNIEEILQAIVDLTEIALQVPEGVEIHANLMVRMMVPVVSKPEPQPGIGIVAYNTDRPAEPSWTRLVEGDFGGGTALKGKVQVIEDTDDPVWHGTFTGNRSRCFASFPVRGSSEEVMAVLNIDADRPRVLTRKNVMKDLLGVIAAPLSLLSSVLQSTMKENANP
jgi:hypothetical protein